MGFSTPWFLTGIAAVGLPFSIHLLRRYQSTPRNFSSLFFFEQQTQSSVMQCRLRYFFLLIMRMALLIAMAVAFANPFVTRRAGPAGGGRPVVIAIDDSFSMRYGDHLNRAKQAAIALVSSLRPHDRGQLLTMDSDVHFLTQPTQDREQLRAAIRTVQPSDGRGSYGELSRVLRTLTESAHQRLEVHFFTDAKASSLPPSFEDMQLGVDTTLVIHNVSEGKKPNWTVESVSAPGRIYAPKNPGVQAVVAGFNTPAAFKTVSLRVDNKVLESKVIEVPENGRATVEFTSLASPYGFHRGEVRIEPADELPNDDRFPFSIERADPARILFLHPANSTRSLLYFQTAIESVVDGGFTVEPLTVEQAAARSFSKYAFVVFSDAGPLPQTLEEELLSYINSGGSLLMSLGNMSEANRRIPIFSEAVLSSNHTANASVRNIAELDSEYPPLRAAGKLEGVSFYHAVRVEPGSSLVAARLTDDSPLLLEKRIGEGRVVLFTSTFDNVWNDFPLHPSFLPFIDQTSRYLAGQRERLPNVAVGSFVDLRTTGNRGTAADVVDPDGKHPLSLKQASSAQTFKLNREGFYEIHLANGLDELVAVHADRSESDLTTIPTGTLNLWRNTGRAADSTLHGAEGPQMRRYSLWQYVLFALLLIVITESLIASRYLSPAKETA